MLVSTASCGLCGFGSRQPDGYPRNLGFSASGRTPHCLGDALRGLASRAHVLGDDRY